MNFLSSIVNKVSESLNISSNFTVSEVAPSSLTQHETFYTGDHLILYKALVGRQFKYLLVLTVPGAVGKYMKLFSVEDENEAVNLFSLYSTRVAPIAAVCKAYSSGTSKLQELCNKVRLRQSDSVSHHVVKLGLMEALKKKHPEIDRNINAQDEDNCTPLHIACQTPTVSDDIVRELMEHGAQVDLLNSHNETALHLAASYSPTKLKILLCRPTTAINALTIYGETPLHIACAKNQPACVEILLQYGADPGISQSYRYPIHCAVRINSIECVRFLVSKYPQQLSIKDGKFGGTALHWARKQEMITLLLEHKAAVDSLSNSGDTALHVMLSTDRRECVNALLIGGANVTIPNHQGETPLHIAIPTDDLAMVRSLVVFGADINSTDRNGCSPRHMAATQKSKNSASILYTIHMVGAVRCSAGKTGCTDGCSYKGTYKGTQVSDVDKKKLKIDDACDDIINAVAIAEAPLDGYRILCLDGGGIRGLILSMMLIRLEEVSGINIRDNFDWISGTSTGGILALALTSGRNARYCLGLYFKLKNKVFCGSKPYSGEVFESLLKEEFGETTLMSELPHPRVAVSAVLADRFPPDFHLFRNYSNPFYQFLPKGEGDKHAPPPKPNEVYVWQAARSSGAAPTFFKASMDRFLDGGLMSNNPTIDTLTEIQEFNTGLKASGQHHLVKPIRCIVSLGTGRPPQISVADIDVYRPSGVMDAYKVVQGANSLLKLVVGQATQSEGRPTERARAWCSMIGASFFRFSPQLSVDITLDETDDDKLLLVCWETMVYLHRNEAKLVKVANILNQTRGHSSPGSRPWIQPY